MIFDFFNLVATASFHSNITICSMHTNLYDEIDCTSCEHDILDKSYEAGKPIRSILNCISFSEPKVGTQQSMILDQIFKWHN